MDCCVCLQDLGVCRWEVFNHKCHMGDLCHAVHLPWWWMGVVVSSCSTPRVTGCASALLLLFNGWSCELVTRPGVSYGYLRPAIRSCLMILGAVNRPGVSHGCLCPWISQLLTTVSSCVLSRYCILTFYFYFWLLTPLCIWLSWMPCYFCGLLRHVGVMQLCSMCDLQNFEVLQDSELSLSWDQCPASVCLSVHFTVTE